MTRDAGEAMSPTRLTGPADALQIAGLVPLSTVDWPDHLVATVFLQGCPWNCFYCHNHDLIPTRVPGTVPWQAVRDLLARRAGLLDGVVFTGGEALRQDALADAAAEVRAAGFQVGLHTAGAYPRRLADLLAAGLVDWVGLDLKALPEHYGQVVGAAGQAAGCKAWESLEILVEHSHRDTNGGALPGTPGPDGDAQPDGGAFTFEVRTTIVPGDVTATDAFAVAERAHGCGARRFALQQVRAQGSAGGFPTTAPGWDGQCEQLSTRIGALGWEVFTYRPA